MATEIENITARYKRREHLDNGLYSPLNLAACLTSQEKERALIHGIHACGLRPLGLKTLLDIGCGSGANLLQFLRLGFRPENMAGNDLLPERTLAAREVLPASLKIFDGDALRLDIPDAQFDVVHQSTVFTSILDPGLQEALADRMWRWARNDGVILWYDFVYDNPRNRDVKGIPLQRIRQLFPYGRMRWRRLTLAPPIARAASRWHPALYSLLNALPLLRTHVLCWIQKGSRSDAT